MVLTVEPGIYIPPGSKGVAKRWWNIGVRIEDDVAVTRDGNEVLTAGLPKEPDAIEKLMNERRWRAIALMSWAVTSPSAAAVSSARRSRWRWPSSASTSSLIEAHPFGTSGSRASTIAPPRCPMAAGASSKRSACGRCWSARRRAIRRIHVSDRGRFGFARLDAAEQGLSALGFVVVNRAIGAALWRRLEESTCGSWRRRACAACSRSTARQRIECDLGRARQRRSSRRSWRSPPTARNPRCAKRPASARRPGTTTRWRS